jgi:hypothetical protein
MKFPGFGRQKGQPRFVFVHPTTGDKFTVRGGEVNDDPSTPPIEVVADPAGVGMMGFGIRPGRVADARLVEKGRASR